MRVKLQHKAGKWTKAERKKILQAVVWAMKKIGINEKGMKLKVVLNADPTVYGDAFYDDDLTCTIRISSKDKKKDRDLRTVFHELWHIHQYLNQGLDLGEKAMFAGKEYEYDYWNAPWEVAAREKEENLLAKYKKHLDKRA
tara:strand:+ start:625 stop:1047 length:423 start_codon:yes stop_codon:yes gene_type:complete